MSILNIKLGKKELIGGIILGIIIVICTLLLLKFTEKNIYYQIVFDSAGGQEIEGQIVVKGNKIKEPQEITREGYIFEGWYQNDNKFDFNTSISEDTILVAKWKQKEENIKEEKKDSTKEEKENKTETKNNNNTKNTITPKKEIDNTIKVNKITLNTNNITLKVGETATLFATISPDNATNKNITWRSNSQIITISNGRITAHEQGEAIVTATIDDQIATCTVKVIKPVSYEYEMKDTPGSAVGQCTIYIKSSEGIYVNGTIKINYRGGGSEIVDVTPNGILRLRNIIESINIINAG